METHFKLKNIFLGRMLPALFLIISIIACSNEEEKLELFSPEAFAYSLDAGWELNASCRVKGFEQKETDNQYSAKLSYIIDLITMEGKINKGVTEGFIDETSKEKLSDLPIEIQIQIDSSYATGKYKIVFNVTDNFSEKEIKLEKEFELSK